MKKIIIIVASFIVVVGLGLYLANQGGGSAPTVSNDFSKVPGDQELLANMQKTNLDPGGTEGTILHIHQHLDIVVNDSPVTLPALIGIGSTFFSPIHTHDTSGIIHVESNVKKDFLLGQFFDEWGIALNSNCISTYCVDSSHKIILAVNGKVVNGNPHDYVLKAHDEIELWYGDINTTPQFISSYNFPEGL